MMERRILIERLSTLNGSIFNGFWLELLHEPNENLSENLLQVFTALERGYQEGLKSTECPYFSIQPTMLERAQSIAWKAGIELRKAEQYKAKVSSFATRIEDGNRKVIEQGELLEDHMNEVLRTSDPDSEVYKLAEQVLARAKGLMNALVRLEFECVRPLSNRAQNVIRDDHSRKVWNRLMAE